MTNTPLTFPNDPAFDYSREVELMREARDKDWARKPWVGLCVSQAWPDESHLEDFVDKLAAKYPGTMILHLGARGASKVALERATAQELRLLEIKSEPFWDTHRQAVQAAHLCRLADVIMCFHAGGTDGVKSVIEKALLTHRPAYHFGHGLHVYEVVKTKATKSRKSQATGRIRYRIRKEFSLVDPPAAKAPQRAAA